MKKDTVDELQCYETYFSQGWRIFVALKKTTVIDETTKALEGIFKRKSEGKTIELFELYGSFCFYKEKNTSRDDQEHYIEMALKSF